MTGLVAEGGEGAVVFGVENKNIKRQEKKKDYHNTGENKRDFWNRHLMRKQVEQDSGLLLLYD